MTDLTDKEELIINLLLVGSDTLTPEKLKSVEKTSIVMAILLIILFLVLILLWVTKSPLL
jgi:hypothetical protein